MNEPVAATSTDTTMLSSSPVIVRSANGDETSAHQVPTRATTATQSATLEEDDTQYVRVTMSPSALRAVDHRNVSEFNFYTCSAQEVGHIEDREIELNVHNSSSSNINEPENIKEEQEEEESGAAGFDTVDIAPYRYRAAITAPRSPLISPRGKVVSVSSTSSSKSSSSRVRQDRRPVVLIKKGGQSEQESVEQATTTTAANKLIDHISYSSTLYTSSHSTATGTADKTTIATNKSTFRPSENLPQSYDLMLNQLANTNSSNNNNRSSVASKSASVNSELSYALNDAVVGREVQSTMATIVTTSSENNYHASQLYDAHGSSSSQRDTDGDDASELLVDDGIERQEQPFDYGMMSTGGGISLSSPSNNSAHFGQGKLA